MPFWGFGLTDINTSDIEALDRVLDRVKRGVPAGREIHQSEILPVLRAAYMWREAAMAANQVIQDAHKRALE